MYSHIKSVCFTTKIRKQGIYGHAFLTLVIIPQCHIYARILNWVAFIVLPSSYARILSWVAFIVLPSSLQPRLLPYFPLVHVACKFVACFFDYTYVWNLCSYYYDLKKRKLVTNEIVTYTNILFSLADDLDNAGIVTYATQRIHESGVTCGS